MSLPESQIEDLVARCVVAGEEYRAELERACAECPAAGDELRQRITRLEELGFLGEHRQGVGTQWLPQCVGGYRLTGLLGRGGMGLVFRGCKDGGPEVAIKIVRPDLLADDRARERFRREALLASRLSHPGICPVLEIGTDDDVPFLVMPLLQGRTFGAWVRAGGRGRQDLLALLEGHARALHAAHEAGLVHRDVTPGNLFVTDDGRAMVLDFGLARDSTGDVATLTLSQELLGTLPYMAPEQIRGHQVDRRTDVYALGIVAYEALAGRLPFVARVRSDVSRLILSGDAPRLSKLTTGVSRPLERVVQTAMDPDPARRYATALELADDLQRLRAGQPVAAHGVGPLLRARRWAAHHPVATTAILSLSLLLVVAGSLIAELSATVRMQQATQQALTSRTQALASRTQALASRTLEQADPMRALEQAIAAHDGQPSPMSLGQLNRLLHNVNMLATASVMPGPVRRLAVHRLDDTHDLVAVAAESGVSLLRLDRRSGSFHKMQDLPALPGVLLGCVRFSPCGRFVAFGGTGKMAFVAAVGSDSVPEPLSGSDGEIFDIEVDDDGNVFAADLTGRLLHWRHGRGSSQLSVVLDLKNNPVFPNYESNLRGVRWGPDGDLLVWNFHYALRVRTDGTLLRSVAPVGKKRESPTVVMDAARDRVLLCQVGRLRMVRWSDGAALWSPLSVMDATDCAIADDGTIASLHGDGVVRFWDGGQHPTAEYRDVQDHIGAVHGVPGTDSFLAVGRGGMQVRLDTRGRIERVLPGGDIERWGVLRTFVWSSDGSVLVAAGGPGRVRSWDFDGSRAAPQARLVASPPLGISPHPDGRRLIVYTDARQAWLWEPGTKPSLLAKLPLAFLARTGAAHGGRLAIGGRVGGGVGGGVAVFDAERSTFRIPFQHRGQYGIVGVAAVSGDRLLIAAADSRFLASRIQMFAAGGTEVLFDQAVQGNWPVPQSLGMLTCMDATADGRRVAFGCADGGLHAWELAEGANEPRTLASAATNGRVWSIDMSADGRFVVAGIEDGSVLRWAVDASEPEVLVAARGRPARCSLADDDRVVIEFAPDGLVRLWDLTAKPAEMVFEVVAGDGAIVKDAVLLHTADVGGGGSRAAELATMRLVTVSSDGWLRMWSLDEPRVVEQARKRLESIETSEASERR